MQCLCDCLCFSVIWLLLLSEWRNSNYHYFFLFFFFHLHSCRLSKLKVCPSPTYWYWQSLPLLRFYFWSNNVGPVIIILEKNQHWKSKVLGLIPFMSLGVQKYMLVWRKEDSERITEKDGIIIHVFCITFHHICIHEVH
jgi:hypothetical protein